MEPRKTFFDYSVFIQPAVIKLALSEEGGKSDPQLPQWNDLLFRFGNYPVRSKRLLIAAENAIVISRLSGIFSRERLYH